VFCAGFDRDVVLGGGPESSAMVRGGFELSERLLSFPRPVVIACTGHAIAMGLFLLLSGDYRIGPAGDSKLTANEVAIGLTMPEAAVAIARQRLTPAAFERAMIVSDVFTPENAVESGILDRVVEADDLQGAARGTAKLLTTLDAEAHAATKLRVRADSLAAIRSGIEAYAGLGPDD
jgi:enoyl-CoA hydratase